MSEALREEQIRPDELMAEQARRYEADISRLLASRDRFVEVACPACEATDSRAKWTKYELSFVECAACETVYMNPRPGPELLEDYYANSENYEYWSRVVFPASEDARREKIFRPRAERIVEIARRHGVESGAVVDIGAGFGSFCQEVKRIGHFDRVVAIEPEPHLAAACRERGLEVIEAPVERAEIGGGADVVTSFEVIEHLFSPAEFISKCKGILPPGGLFVLTCPNGKGFDVLELGAGSSVVDTEHLNYFHPASLGQLLEWHDFEVVEVQTPGMLDAELVRKAVLAGEKDLSSQPFLQRVLIDEWEQLGAGFQRYLAEAGLSSNQWVVARRGS
jgi:2-polyprenyl-3-methyl-5-hydroxy-6-metoxy-1,4-benzoquinol methylase